MLTAQLMEVLMNRDCRREAKLMCLDKNPVLHRTALLTEGSPAEPFLLRTIRSTRRLLARPSSVSFGFRGTVSAYPAAERRSRSVPKRSSSALSTCTARAVDSSQLLEKRLLCTGVESECPSKRTGFGILPKAPATFSKLAYADCCTWSSPGAKNAASPKVITNPRACKLICIFPVRSSSFNWPSRRCMEGARSANSESGVGGAEVVLAALLSGVARWLKAFSTDAETCLAFALFVTDEANMTTKKAKRSVMKSA